MIRSWLVVMILSLLAGCASRVPVPVADTQTPVRIEGVKTASPPADKVHVVKRGETLLGIAREHGLNARELAAWNNLDNSNRIVVGQSLRLSPPLAAAASATPAAAGAEVQPIAGSGSVESRALDGSAAAAVPPASALAPGNSKNFKRAPKGGKLPYSEENLARSKGQDIPPSPVSRAALPPTQMVEQPASTSPSATVGGSEWGWPSAGKIIANFSDNGGGGRGLNRGIDLAGQVGDPVLAAAPGKVIFVGVYPKHGNLVVLLHAEGYSTVYAHNSSVLVKEGQIVKRGQKIAELGDSDADRPKLHFELRHQGRPLDPVKLLPPRR